MGSARIAFAVVVALGLVGSFGAAGCSCNSQDTGATTTMSSSSSGGGSSPSSSSSSGSSGGPFVFTSVGDPTLAPAFDAAVSPDGKIAYFSSNGPDGVGVYSVPVPDMGGTAAKPQKVAAGDPFVTPFGIAVSSDGKTIYVADVAAEGTKNDGGKVWKVSAEGGAPSEVTGGDNTHPRAIDVKSEGGKDQLYLAATVSGVPGVYKLPSDGGEATSVVSGPPLVDPEAIAFDKDGSLWVLDAAGGADGLASLYQVQNGTANLFLAHLVVGFPGGLALSEDGTKLYVSGLDPAKGTAVMWEIDKASKEPMPLSDKLFGAANEPGGLHRAASADVYAFAIAGAKGGVFIAQ